MGNIPTDKMDALLDDAAAYWRNDLGEDFVVDALTLAQFEAKIPAIKTARQQLADINQLQRLKSDEVDDKENGAVQDVVNLRKTLDLKYGKNSRQYRNAPKVPRYPAKKKTDTGGSGTS